MNKIDFAVVITVENCNPNGDPLNGNRPRIDFDGYGEMSDVCIKHKIRNRLYDMGEKILMLGNDRSSDGFKSIKSRFDACEKLKLIKNDKNALESAICAEWIDARLFGAVLPFKGDTASVGIRGPVSIMPAKSLDIVNIKTIQITKSLNVEGDDDKKDSATIGEHFAVERGAYVFYGGIYPQLALKGGLTDDDVNKFKQALITLFENDASSARPAGSMAVHRVYWWEHNCPSGQYSSAKVHKSLRFKPAEEYPYYQVTADELINLEPEIIELW